MKLVRAVMVVLAATVAVHWLPLLLLALAGFPNLIVLLALLVPWILLLLTFRAFRGRRRRITGTGAVGTALNRLRFAVRKERRGASRKESRP